MITYQIEKIDSVAEEVYPLLVEHAKELSPFPESCVVKPDISVYRLLENQDALLIVTARKDGELIGYACFMFSSSLHYENILTAEIDIFYMKPEHRKGMAGIKLLKMAHNECKIKGCTHIVQKCKCHFDLTKIFEKMGFKKMEYVFIKEVL